MDSACKLVYHGKRVEKKIKLIIINEKNESLKNIHIKPLKQTIHLSAMDYGRGNLMAEKMLQYLEEQPAVWNRILENRSQLFQPLEKKFFERKIKRVVLVGSGSSYNASLLAAQFYREMLGLEAQAEVPARIGTLPPLLDPETTLIFAVSQSGLSISTIQAIHLFRKLGFTVAGFTADESSPVAGACDVHQLIDCGDEFIGPKTKGMTASVLTLYLAGMRLCSVTGRLNCEKEATVCSKFLRSFAAAPQNIARCKAFCKANLRNLSEQPFYTIISDGTGYAAACEGALKILETLCVPAYSYEFEEYLHGINNLIAPGICNLFVPVNPANFQWMWKLDDYCRANGCSDFVITSVPDSGFTNALELEGSGCACTQPFETLLLFQIFSVLGSEYKGMNCDKSKFPNFCSLMETKAARRPVH